MNQLTSAQQAVLFSVLLETERMCAANVTVAVAAVPQLEDHYRHQLEAVQQSLRDAFGWSPRFDANGKPIEGAQFRLNRRPSLVERAMEARQ